MDLKLANFFSESLIFLNSLSHHVGQYRELVDGWKEIDCKLVGLVTTISRVST